MVHYFTLFCVSQCEREGEREREREREIEKFAPRGKLGHQGEHSLLFRRMEGRIENVTPRGQSSFLGVKVCPWGRSSECA
jgi:hypothetical protein